MEGSETEPQYFHALKSTLRLGHVILLKSKTKSSPRNVLKRLDNERRKVRQTREASVETQFWAVFDHDDLARDDLEQLCAEATKKGYILADSKPCFELWLLLHFAHIGKFKGLEASGDTRPCLPAERRLAELDDSYDSDRKGKWNASNYMVMVSNAIANAKLTDSQPNYPYLNQIGSRVYKLAESIINSSS